MNHLTLSSDLKLPLDAATEAFAFIGARGSGKTHAAGKLAEEFFAAGVPFVWIDPVGVAYGLRLAKDGKGAGLSVPVFGGLRGDVPLEPTAGALVADLIADKNLSAVLDISQFDTDADKARFCAAFSERLFSRKKKDPAPLHVIVDEAQEVVPQNPQPGEQMMLHRWHRQVKLGRNFGLGVSLLTQRPQEVSKKVLNQCQTVLAFRLTGPQERKTMAEWVTSHGLGQELVDKLPTLPTGNCHVWSPVFLGVSKEVRILPKATFDASATPKVGERRAARELAPIDLEQIKTAMAATIEKAKAEDPKALRQRIADLERTLSNQIHVTQLAATPPEKRVEVPVIKDADLKRLEKVIARAEKLLADLDRERGGIGEAVAVLKMGLREAHVIKDKKPEMELAMLGAPVAKMIDTPRPITPRISKTAVVVEPSEGLTAPQQRILNALAWLEPLGVSPANRNLVAFLSDQSPRSSGYANNLSALRSSGKVVYPNGATVQITAEGRTLANPPALPATNEDVQRVIKHQLPDPQQRILAAVLARGTDVVSRDTIAQEAGQSFTSSGFANNLSSLRSLGLLDYPSGKTVQATDILFPLGERS